MVARKRFGALEEGSALAAGRIPSIAIRPIGHSSGVIHVSNSVTCLKAIAASVVLGLFVAWSLAPASMTPGMIRRRASRRARSSASLRSARLRMYGAITVPTSDPTNPIAAPMIAAVPLSTLRTLEHVSGLAFLKSNRDSSVWSDEDLDLPVVRKVKRDDVWDGVGDCLLVSLVKFLVCGRKRKRVGELEFLASVVKPGTGSHAVMVRTVRALAKVPDLGVDYAWPRGGVGSGFSTARDAYERV